MRIAVCEDEDIYLNLLSDRVREYFECKKINIELATFRDGAPLLHVMGEGQRFELIFLDLQLEDSDGMEVAAKIRELDKQVALIFVTGIENRAVEGYTVAALDYVVKSKLAERLSGVLERYMQMLPQRILAISDGQADTQIVPLVDIVWIESEGRGTRIHTEEGEYSSNSSIGKLAQGLPEGEFVEVHKSVFVRIDAIKRIGQDTIQMNNGASLPMSRRKRKSVMSAVMAAVKGQIL